MTLDCSMILVGHRNVLFGEQLGNTGVVLRVLAGVELSRANDSCFIFIVPWYYYPFFYFVS